MSTLHAAPGPDSSSKIPSDATRHLCAGVYVDEKFRDLVTSEVCTAPHRRVAPSYGFDLVPVLRHAWWATHLAALPRLTTTAVLVAPIALGRPTAELLTLGGFTLLLLLDRAVALASEIARTDEHPTARKKTKPHGRPLPANGWLRRNRARQLKHVGVIALTVTLIMTALALSSPAEAFLAACLGGAVVGAAVLANVVRQLRINHIHKAETLRPRRMSHRESVVERQQVHPYVIYRRPKHKGADDEESTVFTLFGEESPFIGAGELIHQWNPPMNIQLLRPGDEDLPLNQREHRYPPFRTHELVDHLREVVTQLQSDKEEVRLPVEVRDRVYVAESDVSADRTLLRNPVDETLMRRVINEQDPARYHFLEVSVPEAGSELMATVLLQVSLRGRTLSLSFAACALTRNPDHFRKAEEFGQNGKRAIVGAAFAALISLPREVTALWKVVRYPYILAKALVLYRRDLTLTPIRNVPIGSRISIRQAQAQEWSQAQFDKTYLLSHMKNIELRLLRATSDFLRSHNVDISEFDNRAMQIINSGIVNLGGDNNISNTAFGHQAQSHNHDFPQTASTAQNEGTA
ncbi:hypothetical protein [Nocardiopsis halotolerans]|uniref:hypothetical protein n=1 Tax=Nocardiopsis halotolerans TaxID=124252 RepID=UPI00034A82CE|nr:hypothetical protein [Nocardiopsis halotolerans]